MRAVGLIGGSNWPDDEEPNANAVLRVPFKTLYSPAESQDAVWQYAASKRNRLIDTKALQTRGKVLKGALKCGAGSAHQPH